MLRFLLTLTILGLIVYALADLAGARKGETGGLPKWLWVVIILVVPVVGALAWIMVRRTDGTTPPVRDDRTSTGPRRSGPVAPDDDPDFLWRLDQERRRRSHDDPPPQA